MMNKEFELTEDLFDIVSREDKDTEKISHPYIKNRFEIWQSLKSNKLARVGLWIIGIFIIMAFAGTKISGFEYFEQNLNQINQHPDSAHWFGTDELGRDLFTRTWYGVRYSLLIGFMAAIIDFLIGVLYGGIAGINGKRTDFIMMRIAEVIYSIPYLLVVILISVVFSKNGQGSSFLVLVFSLSLTSWVPMAILVRGQVLQLKESEYVKASEALGAGKSWILRKHVIPNALGPILVNTTLSIPRAVFAEATLGFLGLGLQAPKSSLGALANSGLAGLAAGNSYQILIPALFISLIMFAFNVLGDGLRDSLYPRLR